MMLIGNFMATDADGRVSSIQRQLNLYGFRCTNRGEDKGVFHHPDFIQGDYDRARQIRRKIKPVASPQNAKSANVDLSKSKFLSSKRRNSDSSSDDEPVLKRLSLGVEEDPNNFLCSSDEEMEDALFLSVCKDIASWNDDFILDALPSKPFLALPEIFDLEDNEFWTSFTEEPML